MRPARAAALALLVTAAPRGFAAPALLWSQTHVLPGAGASTPDVPLHVAVDGSGNVVVAGRDYVSTPLQRNDWMIRKYDASGNLLWYQGLNGPASGDDVAAGVATDATGDVVVAGWEAVPGQGRDWLVRKLDAGGNLLWTYSYNGGANGDDLAQAVAVGPSGSVYVVGSTVNASGTQWLVTALDPSGAVQWTATVNGAAGVNDRALAVAVDGAGRVAVAGASYNAYAWDDWLVVEYDADGNVLWQSAFDGLASQADVAQAVTVDAAGEVFVGGTETVPAQGSNWRLRKYDAAGTLLWSASSGGAYGGADSLNGLAVDSAGDVLAAGMESSTPYGYAVWRIRKYDPSGNPLWADGYADPVYYDPATARGIASVDARRFVTVGDDNAAWLVRMSTQTDATLAAAVAVSGLGQATVGGTLTVTCTVTNTGAGPANGVVPGLAFSQGRGLLLPGPATPPGPVTLGAGSAATFTWTLSVEGTGAVSLAASATGADAATGLPVTASAGTAFTVAAGGALTAQLTCTPSMVASGSWCLVTLLVTNTSPTYETISSPTLVAISGSALVASASGAYLYASSVAPGDSLSIQWQVQLQGAGTVGFSASATGTNPFGGSTVVTALGQASVSTPGPLLLSLWTDTATPVQGQPFTVHLTLSNAGAVAITNIAGRVTFSAGVAPAAFDLGTLSGLVAPGSATAFTWTPRATVPGPVTVYAQVSANDTVSYDLLRANTWASLTVVSSSAGLLAKVPEGRLLLAPNVLDPNGTGTLQVLAHGEGGGLVRVRIFDAAGQEVAGLLVPTDPTGTGTADFDGRTGAGARLGPGLYWMVADALGVRDRRPFMVLRGGRR